MKRTIFFTALFLLLIACEKKQNSFEVEDYNGTWIYNDPVNQLDNATMFIQNGSVYSFKWNISPTTYIANSSMYLDTKTDEYVQQIKIQGATNSMYELRMLMSSRTSMSISIIFFDTRKPFKQNLTFKRL